MNVFSNISQNFTKAHLNNLIKIIQISFKLYLQSFNLSRTYILITDNFANFTKNVFNIPVKFFKNVFKSSKMF